MLRSSSDEFFIFFVLFGLTTFGAFIIGTFNSLVSISCQYPFCFAVPPCNLPFIRYLQLSRGVLQKVHDRDAKAEVSFPWARNQ